ncbi:hypothetical protein SynA1528_00452 [Synechococcus sp. A15-28]|nr:hypothetical protein SynA1528_00452 [Synechococcus sp. A15-28]
MYLVSPSVRLALGGNETWHITGQNACFALPLHHQRNSGEHFWQSRLTHASKYRIVLFL